MGKSHWHRSQPHDRAIAAGVLGTIAGGEGVSLRSEFAQRGTSGIADVETTSVHGVRAGFPPLNVTVGLIIQVPADRTDAVRESQGHAGVVGPFSRFQAVRPAVSVSSNEYEGAGGFELDGSAERIAHGKSDERSTTTIEAANFHTTPLQSNITNVALTLCARETTKWEYTRNPLAEREGYFGHGSSYGDQ